MTPDGARSGEATTAIEAGDDEALLCAALGMAERPPPLEAGQVIGGAYRVELRLGAGGMGVVYLARDLRLDRDVAIKLHAAGAGAGRLSREARAMAKLTHPNVATVYEAGAWGGRVHVAMEYVEGWTARTWLAAAKRRPAEVMALYVAAGRGLAAAHDCGLVHRDFKPDNVLVGYDGRIKVADFGLARGADELGPGAPPAGPGDSVTRTGAVMGTPAYMAPEQRTRRPIGPSADQFAFAVALWEALAGERPFCDPEGALPADAGRAAPRHMPKHVRAALCRALAPDPAARFPSMNALLAELSRDPWARPRRVAFGAAAFATIACAFAAARASIAAGGPEDPCSRAAETATLTWSAARRERLRGAFAATGRDSAGPTFDRVAARVDAHAAAWRAQQADACRATHLRREQSPSLLDLRTHCLGRRLGELDAALVLLERDTAAVFDRAIELSFNLGDLQACSDVPRLSGSPPPPSDPAARAAVAAIEASIAEARGLYFAGRYAPGLDAATRSVAAADALGRPALGAEARYWVATLQGATGDRASIRATLEAGARLAAEARDDALAANLWVANFQHLVVLLEELEEAERLRPVAESAVVRAGSPPRTEASLLSAVGTLRERQGRPAEARPLLERAIVIEQEASGESSPKLANSLNRLGGVLGELGEHAAAIAALERAARLLEGAYGEGHPLIGFTLTNLGGEHLRRGDAAAARDALERALAVKEAALGPDHPDLASTLANLSTAYVKLQRLAEARPRAERALALVERRFGPGHPTVARALGALAEVQIAAGDRAAARTGLRRALAIQQRAFGADVAETAETREALARLGRRR